MDQATSHRLRTCYLLLLLLSPLLANAQLTTSIDGGDASVDGGNASVDGGNASVDGGNASVDGGNASVDGGNATVDAGTGTPADGGTRGEARPVRLAFVTAPPQLVAGRCEALVLELQDGAGLPSMLSTSILVLLSSTHSNTGHFYATPDCTSAMSSLVFEANTSSRQLWFRDTLAAAEVMLYAAPYTDELQLERATLGPLQLLPGALMRLKVEGFPLIASATTEHTFSITAFDAFENQKTDYLGQVAIKLSDPRLGAGVSPPSPYTFTDLDKGHATFTARFMSTGLQVITAEDTKAAVSGTQEGIRIIAAEPRRFELYGLPAPIVAGTSVSLTVKVLDSAGNLVTNYEGRVQLTSTDTSASLPAELLFTVNDGGIKRVPITFNSAGTWDLVATDVNTPLLRGELTAITVSCQSTGFKPEYSTVALDTDSSEPVLRVANRGLLRFEPRDGCGNLARLPAGTSLAFMGDEPLKFSAPIEESDGRWKAEVGLPECPATGQQPLYLWPTLNGEQVLTASQTRLEVKLWPECLTSEVQLLLRTEPEGLKQAAAGSIVDFVVELQNLSPNTFPQGLLKVSVVDLTVLEVTLEGQPLERHGEAFVLPEVGPGVTLRIKGKAQVAVKAEHSAKAVVWYATAAGAALTEPKVVTLGGQELGVDVGCGCQAGPLSSQLLPWLALLVAASRSRAALRRLKRSERIER